MRDFEAYYAAGAAWNAGANPYSQQIWRYERSLSGVNARRYEALPYVAPPATLPVFGAIAKLRFATANDLWRAILVACIALLATAALRLARRRFHPVACAAAAIAAIGFGPITSALALGQLALPAAAFATLAVAWFPAVFVAWIQPNVALAAAAYCGSLGGALRLLASVVLLAAACVLVAGPHGIAQYASFLRLHSAAEAFSAIQFTPPAIAFGFGLAPATARAFGAAVAVAAICVWALLMRRANDLRERFCVTCALLPFAVSFVHEHDLAILFAPAVVFAARARARVWPLALCGSLLVATDWLGLAQRPDGALQTALLVSACGIALIVLRADFDTRMLAVPAFVAGMIATAAVLASTHPVPVWPDATAALPAGIETWRLSDAWHAEQSATGLFAREPFWAALRLLPLIGCAMLAACAALEHRVDAKCQRS